MAKAVGRDPVAKGVSLAAVDVDSKEVAEGVVEAELSNHQQILDPAHRTGAAGRLREAMLLAFVGLDQADVSGVGRHETLEGDHEEWDGYLVVAG